MKIEKPATKVSPGIRSSLIPQTRNSSDHPEICVNKDGAKALPERKSEISPVKGR
jgi:hypothetical protein